MPTLPERMVAVETEVRQVRSDTTEIKQDVKTLLRWRDEERGARAQRALSFKFFAATLSVVTIVINVIFKVL